jgi:hypothetical protein
LDLHLGEFASAEAALQAAVKVINSRLALGREAEIKTLPNGEITVGIPEENA